MKSVFFAIRLKPLSKCPYARILFYSTDTALASSSTPAPSERKSNKRDTLYSRVSPAGDPTRSVVPILDQWINEGKRFDRKEMVNLIKQLRGYRRYKHALEISEWMSDQRNVYPSPGETAVRLVLIMKVHGIEHAEKYFDSVTKRSKNSPVYSAILYCYAQRKDIGKAETIMQHIRELNFPKTTLTYNTLLGLYCKMGQYEKLDSIMKEMEEKGIQPDKFTLTIKLSAYATKSDIDGMEVTLHRMIKDHGANLDWHWYANAAHWYIKVGLIEKALKMLKETERLATKEKKGVAYNHLLTLYAGIGRKEELYRIWDLYKSSQKLYNAAYRCMISSLLKLHDIAGAEKIFEEWESLNTTYDIRVPSLLIIALCKNGFLEKAEELINKAIEKGRNLYAYTWDCLATGYAEAYEMPKGVKAMEAAFLANHPGFKPNRATLASCLVYLKQHGDMEKAEEFVLLLESAGNFSKDDCGKLRDYMYDRTTEFDITSMADGDGSSEDEETDDIASKAS